MSAVESLDLKNLHVIVIQEFQSEDIQELNSDFFRNLSNTIGKLKNEEYDGIERKAKNQIISTTTNLIELLVNKRLEKISNSTKIPYNILTDEEKAIATRINKEVGYEGTPFVGDVLGDAGNVDLGLRSAKK